MGYMVEEISNTTTQAASSEAASVVTAPVEAASSNAPVGVTESAKVESTVLGAQPVTEATVEKPAQENKAPEAKPAEVEPKNEGDATESPQDGDQSAEPAPLPTYEAFTFPEGVAADAEQIGDFTKALAEFENSKPTHEEFQKFGQNLVERGIALQQDTVKRLNDYYASAWEKQKTDWYDEFSKDPEIGGNRKETTENAALEFLRTHGGNAQEQQEFRDLMDKTGIGNHKAMIRLLAKANMAMKEGQPLPANKPMPEVKSKVQKRYGNM